MTGRSRTPTPDAALPTLTILELYVENRNRLNGLIKQLITEAVERGAPTEVVADAAGVTRQHIWKKYIK